MELLQQVMGLFQKGGLVMYPLIVCSIIVLTIGVERFYAYRQARADSNELMSALEPVVESGNWQEALKICDRMPGAVAEVLKRGISRLGQESHNIQNALDGAASLVTARLRQRLSYLDTIVTLSPLLGLLGTVIGMINSFSVLNVRSGQPQAITGGVGEALIATATGLCVAVFALVVHSYFSQRLDDIVTDMEQGCTRLLDIVERGR